MEPQLDRLLSDGAYVRTTLPRLSAHNVCNPSVIVDGGKLLVVYKGINYNLRESGYEGTYGGMPVSFSDSQNYRAILSFDLEVLWHGFVEDRHLRGHKMAQNGIQDLRLFQWRGKRYCAGAAITYLPVPESKMYRKFTSMLISELLDGTMAARWFLPSRRAYEKNWMPWVKDGELYMVYAPDPYEVLHVGNGLATVAFGPQAIPELAGQSGGSCVIPLGERFLSVVHRKYAGELHGEEGTDRLLRYTHAIVIHGVNFEVLAVSPEFTFEGERVEFCCGAAIDGDNLFLSYGVWDEEAVVARASLRATLGALGLGDYVP